MSHLINISKRIFTTSHSVFSIFLDVVAEFSSSFSWNEWFFRNIFFKKKKKCCGRLVSFICNFILSIYFLLSLPLWFQISRRESISRQVKARAHVHSSEKCKNLVYISVSPLGSKRKKKTTTRDGMNIQRQRTAKRIKECIFYAIYVRRI